MPDPWSAEMEALGAFIRSQRKLARLSLRQLAELTSLSNPYLSQVERGRHQPSVRVLKLIAEALNISAETLLIEAGLLDAQAGDASDLADEHVAAAIRADHRLTSEQKAALIADRVVDPRNARLLAERISRADLVTFRGLGHLFFWEDPDAFAATVTSFLNGRDDSGPLSDRSGATPG